MNTRIATAAALAAGLLLTGCGSSSSSSNRSTASTTGASTSNTTSALTTNTVSTPTTIAQPTSGSLAPTVGCSIALARVQSHAEGEADEICIRGRWLPVRVVKPPFVRNGQVRV